MRASYMEVNLDNYLSNIEQIKKCVGENVTLMPVIKANGYGTYINFREDILNKFDIVAIAEAEEGALLRKNGYTNEIFCLNQPDYTDYELIVENQITIGLSSKEFLEKISEKQECINVHLEIETGMGRTGIPISELEEFILKLQDSKNIKVEGIYTHFSSADIDMEYTNSQIDKFEEAVMIAEAKLGKLKYIHAQASNGILNFRNDKFNFRPYRR